MQYLGFALVVLAAIGLIFGLMQHLKGRKVLSAPFKQTGEIAQNPGVADAKGIVSCEGTIQTREPAIAPCSGKPCVYFEIEVVQEWEKQATTEDGAKTEHGKTTIQTVKSGAVFFVDDGSGPVAVDPREGMDVELDPSFEQQQNVSFGDVMFGQFHTNVPSPAGRHGRAVTVVEKIVPIEGSMFVMGQLVNQTVTKPKGMLGSLKASRKGRASMVRVTKRNSRIGFVAGGVLLLPGVALAVLASPPAPPAAGADACNILDQSKDDAPCMGKINNDTGYDVPLTVTQAGTFALQGGPPKGKKIPVIAALTVKSEAGTVVLPEAHEQGTVDLQPGKYVINIKDSIPGDAAHLKGGFSFELSVKRTALLAPDASASASDASASDASASDASSATAAAAAKPAAKAPTAVKHGAPAKPPKSKSGKKP